MLMLCLLRHLLNCHRVLKVHSNTVNGLIRIGSNDVVVGDYFKGPIIISSSAQPQVNTSSGPSLRGSDDH
jgi:hypothetical protein